MITSEGIFSNRLLSCRGSNATTQDQRPLAGQKWIDDNRLSTDDGDEVAGLRGGPTANTTPDTRSGSAVTSKGRRRVFPAPTGNFFLFGKDCARRIPIGAATSNLSIRDPITRETPPFCENCATAASMAPVRGG